MHNNFAPDIIKRANDPRKLLESLWEQFVKEKSSVSGVLEKLD